MILFELTETEDDPVYQALEISNDNRQGDFLCSLFEAALASDKIVLSQHVIKALNFHAITCLHTNPGVYRPCEVMVGDHNPPYHFRVQALMDDFVNTINRGWETGDPVEMAAFVLWRLNYIHPFINGNGRTARAVCYFVLCAKLGFWLPGEVILPELIRRDREAYILALTQVDESYRAGELNLEPLHSLLSRLLQQQLATTPLS